VMRRQIHPFRPHDFGKQLHTYLPARSRSLSPELAALENKNFTPEPFTNAWPAMLGVCLFTVKAMAV
jgi:hypothetical protein